MPWINVKATFSIQVIIFTLLNTYFQSKSSIYNCKPPIYNPINLSFPFTTLGFLFKTRVSYLQPKYPIYNPQFLKVPQLLLFWLY